MIKVPSLKI